MSRSSNKLRFSTSASRGGLSAAVNHGSSSALTWRLLLALIIAGVALGVLHNRWRAQQTLDPVLGAPRVLASPVQQAGKGIGETVGFWWGGLFRGVDAERENRKLRAQVRDLTLKNEQLQSQSREAPRLRELLNLPPTRLKKGIVASITTMLPSPYFESVAVDRGSAQGVRDAWVARTGTGLIGQVTEASLLSSQVMLLTDFNSAVSVLVRRAGKVVAGGVVRGAGRGEPLDLVFVRREASLRVGDKVVSSGYGGVVPPEIPVGIVTRVSQRKESLTKSAKVLPFAGMPGDRGEVLLIPSGQSMADKRPEAENKLSADANWNGGAPALDRATDARNKEPRPNTGAGTPPR